MSTSSLVAYPKRIHQNHDVGKKKKENVAPIGISVSANAGMDAYCETNRRIKRATISDILIWFLKQPAPVQTAILGIEDGMQASYADVIRRIAEDLDQTDPPPRSYKLGKIINQASDEGRTESPSEPPAKPPVHRPKGQGR